MKAIVLSNLKDGFEPALSLTSDMADIVVKEELFAEFLDDFQYIENFSEMDSLRREYDEVLKAFGKMSEKQVLCFYSICEWAVIEQNENPAPQD